jgi:hypothetical protein
MVLVLGYMENFQEKQLILAQVRILFTLGSAAAN